MLLNFTTFLERAANNLEQNQDFQVKKQEINTLLIKMLGYSQQLKTLNNSFTDTTQVLSNSPLRFKGYKEKQAKIVEEYAKKREQVVGRIKSVSYMYLNHDFKAFTTENTIPKVEEITLDLKFLDDAFFDAEKEMIRMEVLTSILEVDFRNQIVGKKEEVYVDLDDVIEENSIQNEKTVVIFEENKNKEQNNAEMHHKTDELNFWSYFQHHVNDIQGLHGATLQQKLMYAMSQIKNAEFEPILDNLVYFYTNFWFQNKKVDFKGNETKETFTIPNVVKEITSAKVAKGTLVANYDEIEEVAQQNMKNTTEFFQILTAKLNGRGIPVELLPISQMAYFILEGNVNQKIFEVKINQVLNKIGSSVKQQHEAFKEGITHLPDSIKMDLQGAPGLKIALDRSTLD